MATLYTMYIVLCETGDRTRDRIVIRSMMGSVIKIVSGAGSEYSGSDVNSTHSEWP